MTDTPRTPDSPETPDAPDTQAPPTQRPATLVFTQAVLALQALAAIFATLVVFGLGRAGAVSATGPWVWVAGLALMLALGYVAGKQRTSWGRIAGWVLQAPMLAAGLIEPMIAVIGGMFLVLWVMGLRLGGRIDRERAEREAELA
jgi:hypothetical protein